MAVIHPGMAAERPRLVESQTMPVEIYSRKFISGGLGGGRQQPRISLQVPRDRTLSGQGYLWLSKALGFLGHSSTFVKDCSFTFGIFLFPATYQCNVKLNGKTVVITGGNTGIGKETARDLAKRGAKVIICCRDTEKGRQAADEIRQETTDANVTVKPLDLASFSSIRQFAKEIQSSEPQINILINNAGVAVCPKSKTADGFELQFGVNHLGHFLLTNLLLDKIKASAPARIVNVTSAAHLIGDINFDDINMEKNYSALMSYCNSKLANILFTRELAKKLEGTGVSTYCLHPGCVHTELSRNISSVNRIIGSIYDFVMKLTFKSASKGASTTIYCAVEKSLASESGLYYTACRSLRPSTSATDDALAKKLWEFSEYLIASVK